MNKKLTEENLKKLRVENNLKQRDIYSFLKISSSSYSSYETNKILIPTEIIYKIAVNSENINLNLLNILTLLSVKKSGILKIFIKKRKAGLQKMI